MVMPELSSSIVHPSKRTQVYAGRHQKIEDSVSSTNPVDGRLDVFNLLGDHGRVMGPSVDAGKDSENSEDSCSKSRMKSLCGKNLAYSSEAWSGKGEAGQNREEKLSFQCRI